MFNVITSETIGSKIRQARIESKISQQELGSLLKKSHAAISYIESGKTEITVNDLLQISEYLKKPLAFFFDIQTEVPDLSIQTQGKKEKEIDSDAGNLVITSQVSEVSFT